MVVGLTGGIGSGKSTILEYFKSFSHFYKLTPIYIQFLSLKAQLNKLS